MLPKAHRLTNSGISGGPSGLASGRRPPRWSCTVPSTVVMFQCVLGSPLVSPWGFGGAAPGGPPDSTRDSWQAGRCSLGITVGDSCAACRWGAALARLLRREAMSRRGLSWRCGIRADDGG